MLPPLNFGVSDKQLITTIEEIQRDKLFQTLLYSIEPLIINHYQTIFDEVWKTGIDSQERINQIETGIASEYSKVIENPLQTIQLLIDLVNDAKEEIMIVFSSYMEVKRFASIGIIDIL